MALNGVDALKSFLSTFEPKYTDSEHSSFQAILATITKKDKVEFERLTRALSGPQKVRYNEYKADWRTYVTLKANARAETEAVKAQATQKLADIAAQKKVVLHQYGSSLAPSLKTSPTSKPADAPKPRSAPGYTY